MNKANFSAIAQKVIALMEDPSWLESADVFTFSANELLPKPEFIPEPVSKEEGVRG